MIIILSPAKTFTKEKYPYQSEPLFMNHSIKLNNRLKELSDTDLTNQMKLSNALLSDVKSYIDTFGTNLSSAIYSYAGQAFRGLDVKSLKEKDLNYLKTHLYILSGLYGIIRPFDAISKYRLEMNFKGIGNLYSFWHKSVNSYLKETLVNEIMIDLSSNEYSLLIDKSPNIYQVKFYQKIDNQLKSISMHVKHMRGLMARHLIQTQIDSISKLKQIKLEGYSYHEELSKDNEIIFIKED